VRRVLILLVTAVVLVAAGCGGGGGGGGGSVKPVGPPLTKTEYQAKLKQIAKDISTKLGSTVSTSKKPTKQDVEKTQTALRAFADELEKVNPPAEVKSLHAQLVSTMRGFADELPGLIDKLVNTKDPSAAIGVLFGAKSIQALIKLSQAYKAKGYNLNLNP
jgi:hypothetical protein